MQAAWRRRAAYDEAKARVEERKPARAATRIQVEIAPLIFSSPEANLSLTRTFRVSTWIQAAMRAKQPQREFARAKGAGETIQAASRGALEMLEREEYVCIEFEVEDVAHKSLGWLAPQSAR